MKISLVLPSMNPSGGVKVALIYAKKLSERGHTVTVISAKPKQPSFKQRVRMLLRLEWPWSTPLVSLEGWSGRHMTLNRDEIMKGSAFPDADVVVATWWETAEWISSLPLSKGAKAYFIQGHEIFDYLPVERVIATYKLPFQKIVISKWLLRTLQDAYGIEEADLVPNSYDHNQYFASVRNKSILPTVGFLYSGTTLKGSDAAIATIRILQTRFPNLRVVAFGTTAPKKNAQLVENFEFHLLPKQHAIRAIYSLCDVWLSGSRSEGFNLTALEAMACRTPLVSTRTGWPCDAIIDGKNGYLVEVDDIMSMASAVEKILNLPNDKWQKMSLEAYKSASFGTWDTSAKAFEASLEKCIELQATPKPGHY